MYFLDISQVSEAADFISGLRYALKETQVNMGSQL
jgi:hypothetical protein